MSENENNNQQSGESNISEILNRILSRTSAAAASEEVTDKSPESEPAAEQEDGASDAASSAEGEAESGEAHQIFESIEEYEPDGIASDPDGETVIYERGVTASEDSSSDEEGADMFGAYGGESEKSGDDFGDLDENAVSEPDEMPTMVTTAVETKDDNMNKTVVVEPASDGTTAKGRKGSIEDVDIDVGDDGRSQASDDDLDDEDTVGLDDFDMNIMLGLGLEDELKETVGSDKVMKFVERQQADIEKAKKLNDERASLDFEYTAKSQRKEILTAYVGEYTLAKVKLVASIVFAFILMLFECHETFGIEITGIFDPTMYPVVYIMAGLQILFFIAALGIKAITSGISSFFHGKPNPEIISAIVLIFDIIYSVAICFSSDFGESGPETFHFAAALCFIIMYIYELLNLRSEIYSFSVVSSNKTKYALTGLPISNAYRELEAFSDMMDEDDDPEDIGVLRVERSDFVDDFFLRTNHYPGGRKFIGYIIPALICIAAAFFAYKYSATQSIYSGMHAAATALFTCAPVSLFFMFSVPFCRATEKANSSGGAIIGEASVDEYSDAAVISFDDTNVFGAGGVSVLEINMFDNARIDRVFYYAASVFCTTGGPLSDLFARATKDIGHSDDVTLMRCMPGLIEAQVNGNFVAIGSLEVLEREGRRIPRKLKLHADEEFGPAVSAMYMVLNGKFTARILVKYTVSPDFESTLKQLDKNGLFVGIRTFDPNITEEFLGRQIDLKAYPLRIIRCTSIDDRLKVSENIRSGLISKKSAKSLLSLIGMCEKIIHVRSVNTMIVVISIFVSLLIATLSILFGALTLSSLSIVIYQLVWMIPMLIISLSLI